MPISGKNHIYQKKHLQIGLCDDFSLFNECAIALSYIKIVALVAHTKAVQYSYNILSINMLIMSSHCRLIFYSKKTVPIDMKI